MSVTSGFFNSLNGDRKYNAEQMSAIFDGIINDGIFANIGTAFTVNANEGNTIAIGIGRAWFNSAWVYNDAILLLTAEDSEILLDRYDAVVIEVDHSDAVRMGSIKIVKGSASSSPSYPTLEDSTYIHQYPLAYLYRKAGSSEISQANITSMIGTSACPYITGILQVQSIDNIVAQWWAQWNQWYTNQTAEGENGISSWVAAQQIAFDTWFRNLQDQVAPFVSTQKDIVIPITGWTDDTDTDGSYALYADIAIDDVAESTIPIMTVLPPYHQAANQCGLAPAARTIDGALRVYAQEVPETEIVCSLVLMAADGSASSSGNTSGYSIPIASATQPGGVKIGEGLTIDDDGTLSVDSESITDAIAATDDDVNALIDEIYGADNNSAE